MNDEQAKQDLQLIREMLEKSRRATAESGWQFIFWGVLIILALIGDYILVQLEQYQWIWPNWIIFMGGGGIFTLVAGFKQRRRRGAMTYTQSAASHFVIACSVGFMMTGLFFPLLKLYSVNVIPVMVSLIAGMLVFSLAGVYESGVLRWFALVWWLGAVAMIPLRETDRLLIFIPLMIIGYLVPGFIFRAKYRKAKDLRES